MKALKILTITLLVTAIYSCGSTYNISSDQENDVDFEKYKTYSILNHDHGFPKGANPINHQRLDRAIESNLQALGYEQSRNSDLWVAWFVKVEDKTQVERYHHYYNRWRSFDTINVHQYKEGSLVIDIIDRKTKMVIWHGSASSQVYEQMPDIDEKIKKVVKAMFQRYQKDTNISKPVTASIN